MPPAASLKGNRRLAGDRAVNGKGPVSWKRAPESREGAGGKRLWSGFFPSGVGALCAGQRLRGEELDPFEDGALRSVALALVEFDDAGVTAVAFPETGGDILEQDSDDVFVLAPHFAVGFAPVQ